MKTRELCELPVKELGTDSTILLLWATNPCLPDAFKVIEAWGFKYKTAMAWVKLADERPNSDILKLAYGTGFWARGCFEQILVCTRKKSKAPRSSYLGILANRMNHSRKPECLHEYAESIAQGPFLEMFAREYREGWVQWGNEI
jgi:N6-adenosine-specific RNA methylase IME4